MIPDSPTTPLPPLIVILGPTASGKTDLAVELAKEFSGEIVNADSRQIYKEIDIASAKPRLTAYGLQLTAYKGVPHHLFDVVSPDEAFNVTHFRKSAIEIIKQIHGRGSLPFLVGGTGLWISALVDNLEFPEVPPNKELRIKLESLIPERSASEVEGLPKDSLGVHRDTLAASRPLRQAQGISTQDLYKHLITLDPNAASFIDPRNRRRIIRALEVIEATGSPFSKQRRKSPPLFQTLQLGLTWPIDVLEERIAKRLDGQIDEGLIEEARELFSKYDASLPALSSISLREWAAFLEGRQSRDETLSLIRTHNRQYAKRQMTWFKRDKRVHWIKNRNEASRLIQNFLQLSSRT